MNYFQSVRKSWQHNCMCVFFSSKKKKTLDRSFRLLFKVYICAQIFLRQMLRVHALDYFEWPYESMALTMTIDYDKTPISFFSLKTRLEIVQPKYLLNLAV